MWIEKLDPNEVFVYGANEAGRHGRGAARQALKFGAKYGQYGYNGQTYGIPTKDKDLNVLSIDRIGQHVKVFLEFAESRPDLTFLVTEIGCGLAGYEVKDIAPLFSKVPTNVKLNERFSQHNLPVLRII